MLGLVNGEALGNPLRKLQVGVVPAPFQFLERNCVGPVAIHLVGGHVNEGRLRAVSPRRLQQVQRAHGVDIKVVERNAGRQVVRGLGRGVDDDGRLERLDQLQHGAAITNIKLVVCEPCQRLPQPLPVPAGVALRAEERLALVVVHAVNREAASMEDGSDFRADQAG